MAASGRAPERRRVVHVCSGHSADDSRVMHRACAALAAAGYEVHLIARDPGLAAPSGLGVIVHSLVAPKGRLERLARRHRIAEQAARLRPDLVHVHEPELLGPVLGAANGVPVIWDAHEAYLDVLMSREWIPVPLRPVARAIWDWWERELSVRCAAVIAATPGVAARYAAFGLHPVVVANYPCVSANTALVAGRREPGLCVFTGTIARNRGLVQVVEALRVLKNRSMDVRVALAGAPDSPAVLADLLTAARRCGVADRVDYRGILGRGETLSLQAQASIGLVPHLPYGNNLVAWPVKMLEFMAAGLPLVFTDIEVHRELLGGVKAGIAVDAQRPEAIADAIGYLLTHPDEAMCMGQAGRAAVLDHLNWEAESKKLLSLYARVLGSAGNGAGKGGEIT